MVTRAGEARASRTMDADASVRPEKRAMWRVHRDASLNF